MTNEQQQKISDALEHLVEVIDHPEARVMVLVDLPQGETAQGSMMGEIVTANFDCSICMVNMLASAIVQVNDSHHDDNPQHLH